MELLVVATVLGILAAVYFKRQADSANSDAILAEKRGEDKILKREQDEVKKQIEDVKNSDSSQLSPEDREKRWEN